VQVDANFPAVFVDRIRLVEVIQNLVENAIKFTKGQSDPKIEIGVRHDVEQPVFFVQDNGIGIEEKYQAKIFGLFEKLDQKSEGTGVGLALVKRIIEIHKGKIWVESVQGKGTTFYFTLGNPPVKKTANNGEEKYKKSGS
ncbi:MAG TPA: histidine kinase, partial [Flavobacteriales bacterium]|nr:histidine kinase [Flavobacteriales bacterium]